MWFCRTNDIVQKKDIIEHDHDVFVWIDWRILSGAYRTARSPHVFPDLVERLNLHPMAIPAHSWCLVERSERMEVFGHKIFSRGPSMWLVSIAALLRR